MFCPDFGIKADDAVAKRCEQKESNVNKSLKRCPKVYRGILFFFHMGNHAN